MVKRLLAVLFFAAVAMPVAAQLSDEIPVVPELESRRAPLTVEYDDDGAPRIVGSDNLFSPKAAQMAARRREAVTQRLASKQKGGRSHEVARGQFVDFPVERTDRIFVLLVEFGSQPGTLASPVNPPLPTAPGPLHNTIPAPDRNVDNSNIWQPSYEREHYVDMYFRQMVDYYKSQSSGRYTFTGDVSHWVKVPFNGARYGSNKSGIGFAATWTLIADGINLWTAAQLAAGKSLDEVKDYLKTFDIYDRYDWDKDGNFDEPDGYIDHMQLVHAGSGEETGGGVLGGDAIWSHRWQAFYFLDGRPANPTVNFPALGPGHNKDGGIEFGGGWGANPNGSTLGTSAGAVRGVTTANLNAATVTNAFPATPTGIWVGDYTIQPENGGLGVFAHEYAHDLGLPDHYDTANGTNGTGFWNLMSSGSYLSNGIEASGLTPGDMSAWDKLQLDWLSYEEAEVGKFSVHKLGPAETTTKAAQAILINLPPSQNFKFEYDPVAVQGALGKVWYSGTGNSYAATMSRQVTVPAENATLKIRMSYNIETGWDYAYVAVSRNGTAWTNLPSPGLTQSTCAPTTPPTPCPGNPNGLNLGNGITGNTNGAWLNTSFDLSAYKGETVFVRISYLTDSVDAFWGLAVDNIEVGSFVDDAEASPNGWTLSKFFSSGGRFITNKPHFYLAEFRQYRGYDKGLQTGPYSSSAILGQPEWNHHYPYQDGMLVTYADEDQVDNNTSVHRGEGFALPLDASPAPITRIGVPEPGTDRKWNFSVLGPTVSVYDATFSLEPTDAFTLPFVGTLPQLPDAPAGSPATRSVQFFLDIPSHPGNPVFNDLNLYWSAGLANSSAIHPQSGTSIRIVSTSAHDSFMHVHVNGN